MNQDGSKKTNTYKELRRLKRELFRISRELRMEDDKANRKELEKYVNDLKIDLGWRLFDCGEYDKGLALYASLPSQTYGEIKCNGMSRALSAMGYYDEARRLLERGLKRFPQSYSLWVAMGAFQAEIGMKFEALECFETATRFAPEHDSTAQLNKTHVLRELGCYGDAVAILEDLIQKDPRNPRYFIVMGGCHQDMGYPGDALQDYRKAMELWQENPTDCEGGWIYMGLYAAYRTQGMLKEGMAVAEEGLKRFPDEDPGLYQNLGDAYYAMGWQTDAADILKEGIRKFPEDEELKKVLKNMEENMEDPGDDQKPPILGLIVLLSLLRKRFGRKRP